MRYYSYWYVSRSMGFAIGYLYWYALGILMLYEGRTPLTFLLLP